MQGHKYFAGGVTASNVTYSNTSSGLSATNVQSAVDELVSDVLHARNITYNTDRISVPAYSSVDIDTGIAPKNGVITYAGRYGGHPRAVITNIWTSGGTVHYTSFNPTNAAITLENATVIEFYTNGTGASASTNAISGKAELMAQPEESEVI